MKRILSFILCAVMVLSVFSGCSKKQQAGKPTVTPGQQTDKPVDPAQQDLTLTYYPNRSMNPLLATDYTNRALFSLIYQGLFAVDRNYNVEPMLCKRYTVSADKRTYVFYLENATFSDGTHITARDAAASL